MEMGAPDGAAAAPRTVTPEEVLATPMPPNDSGATTIRGYLAALLGEVWRKTDNFSGKRPFGNGDWDWDLMVPLVRAGYIRGDLDEDGYLNDCDDDEGRRLAFDAIEYLGSASSGRGDAA